MFPFIQAFISLFMPRPTMDDPASLLLDPAGILSTRIFHCLYKSWAVLNPNPDEVLTGLEVICIMHNKHHDYPEHDFLVVETKDRQRKTRLFILERNVSNQQDEAFIEPAKRDEKIKEVATKAISGSDGSRLASIEEGSQSSISTTLSSPQSADLVSDSLDKPPTTPADDRFLGESYASKPKWQGKNIRYIKPTRLSLYELALLANAVHKLHPTYECYYVDLVYNAVEQYFGVCAKDANENQGRLVYVDGSCLSNKYGRWRGAMINRTKPEDVSLAIKAYKEARTEDMKFVSL